MTVIFSLLSHSISQSRCTEFAMSDPKEDFHSGFTSILLPCVAETFTLIDRFSMLSYCMHVTTPRAALEKYVDSHISFRTGKMG